MRHNWPKQLTEAYAWEKQTLEQLAERYHKSIPWIRVQLDAYQLPVGQPYQTLRPQPVALAIDGWFFRRGDGHLVFRVPNLKRNLHWQRIGYETVADYEQGLTRLARAGWTVTGLVVDGRKGVVIRLSSFYPVQICHFHQLATITRYLTKRPRSEAAQELRALSLTLTCTTREHLEAYLALWYFEWEELLAERTYHDSCTKTGRRRWSYTHRGIRSAYRSLNSNLPYLFTYQEQPELGLPNTTNSQDGSVSHTRTLLRVHRGLKLNRRDKLTDVLLRGKPPRKFH